MQICVTCTNNIMLFVSLQSKLARAYSTIASKLLFNFNSLVTNSEYFLKIVLKKILKIELKSAAFYDPKVVWLFIRNKQVVVFMYIHVDSYAFMYIDIHCE